MHTSTSRYAILPGTQVPAFFNHRATADGSLKIKLTESPLSTFLRFKACIMLVKVNEEMSFDQRTMRVEIDIKDEQKDKFVPDPYYGGAQGFEKVLDLLEDACESLLDSIPVES